MKKILFSIGLLLTGVSAFADSLTFTIPGNTQTNLFSAPIKWNNLTVISTNAALLQIFDAPGTSQTNIVGAFSNIVQYATNVSQVYTDFFGKPTTNWLTNALVYKTNSIASQTNFYGTVFTYQFPSNATTTFPNMGLSFVNGTLVTNNSANTLTLTVTYTGN